MAAYRSALRADRPRLPPRNTTLRLWKFRGEPLTPNSVTEMSKFSVGIYLFCVCKITENPETSNGASSRIGHLKIKRKPKNVKKERFPQQNRRGVWGVDRKKRYLTVKRGGEVSSMGHRFFLVIFFS